MSRRSTQTDAPEVAIHPAGPVAAGPERQATAPRLSPAGGDAGRLNVYNPARRTAGRPGASATTGHAAPDPNRMHRIPG